MGALLLLRMFGLVALLGLLLGLGGVASPTTPSAATLNAASPNPAPFTLLAGDLSPPIWPRWMGWASWYRTALSRRPRWTACCTPNCVARVPS